MPKYGTHVSNFTTSTSVKTATALWGVSNRRAEIVELYLTGSGQAAVADIPVEASGAFLSTVLVGVGTTTTPEKTSGQGAAAAGSCTTTTFTQEPTTYGTVFPVFFGFNTRGGQRWSVPQGEGQRVDSGPTQNRFGWRARAQSGTPGVDTSMNWWED